MNISKNQNKKHNIEIMFLMVLFLIFTFSAVSVLLLAVNSYRNVVLAGESNSSARTAVAYVREVVRQSDSNGAISVAQIDGVDCIVIDEGQDVHRYLYQYDGYLRELNAKDDSGATWDFGQEIMQVESMEISAIGDGRVLEVTIVDANGNSEVVDIALKSHKSAVIQGGANDEE